MYFALEPKVTIIDGLKLKSKGIFNLDDLYKEMVIWFNHYGYEWKELEYKKVENADGTTKTELRWECPKKVDDYVSIQTSIFMQAVVSDVEVTVGNEKKKMNKGSMELKFSTALLKNMDAWKNGLMGNITGLIYDRILIKERLRAYELNTLLETQKLIKEVKEYLQIYAQ